MKSSIDIFGNPPAKTLAQKALFQLNMHIFCTNVGRTKESIDAMDKTLTLLKQQANLEWAGECSDEDFEINRGGIGFVSRSLKGDDNE